MSHLGEMVCYHCNYCKLQSRFLTCPDGPNKRNWDSLRPNVDEINKFLNKLPGYTHEKIDGYDDKTNNRSFDRALEASGLNVKVWKDQRFLVLQKKAQLICDVIKKNVDFEKAFQRVKLAKSILRNFKIDDGELSPGEVKRAKEKAVLVALSSYKVNPWNSPSIARNGTPKEQGSFPFDSQESLDPVLQGVLQRESSRTRTRRRKGKGKGKGKGKRQTRKK
jgi:hypothetical protein